MMTHNHTGDSYSLQWLTFTLMTHTLMITLMTQSFWWLTLTKLTQSTQVMHRHSSDLHSDDSHSLRWLALTLWIWHSDDSKSFRRHSQSGDSQSVQWLTVSLVFHSQSGDSLILMTHVNSSDSKSHMIQIHSSDARPFRWLTVIPVTQINFNDSESLWQLTFTVMIHSSDSQSLRWLTVILRLTFTSGTQSLWWLIITLDGLHSLWWLTFSPMTHIHFDDSHTL